MNIIHKQNLQLTHNEQILQMPINAKILCAQIQYGKICIWYKCQSNEIMESRFFWLIGTGLEIEKDNLVFIGTIQQPGEGLVWHVFERLSKFPPLKVVK